MAFDHKILDSLPLPEEEDIQRVLQILKAIASARVFPYFRNIRVTESTCIARLSSHLSLERMEDEENRTPIVSLISLRGGQQRILVHERVFDYLAFVIPSHPDSRLGGKTTEEAKMLAFAEFVLRHQIEHLLYPHRTEPEIIDADVSFAMDRRDEDPTYYRMLRNALADELNGLQGAPYRSLLDAAEEERPYDYLIAQIQSAHVSALADLPGGLLEAVFPVLDTDLKRMLLGEFYQRSRNTRYSLRRRTYHLDTVMRLFAVAVGQDEDEARIILHAFKDRWGLLTLFHEMDLPESSLEGKEEEDIYAFLREHLVMGRAAERDAETPSPQERGKAAPGQGPETKPVKSLKDRLDEARNDPAFPRQAVEVIERNKMSAVGHSGPKYTELLETLLAIPWGNLQKIEVRPREFEQGLNRTHYGLKRPKEILCDFFSNLIWRYQQPHSEDPGDFHRTGSAFLFVGPPGVGKTSLAISLAKNLNLPYHKISLGGMSDEADLRGHGFTWEGSKPGAIVQGLIKMGVMNGLFIMDEADKTERFAIATLLEILDPEQNHLFHDKYTQTSVDIDLSRCHFILTANTLETVPPAVVDRCEVIFLDRYGVEEKIAIARQYLIERVRRRHRISEGQIAFAKGQEEELLRHLIRTYTYEAGVRQLERVIRTLFLRVFRKEILMRDRKIVIIDREGIKKHLDAPTRPWQIHEEDRVGETLALGVNLERGIGSIIPIQATRIPFEGDGSEGASGYLSMVHATGSIEKVMDESRKVATTGIFYCSKALGIDTAPRNASIHLHFMGASTPKDGPSAGGAIGLALTSVLTGRPVRRDVAMTGEMDTQGRILPVGGLDVKLETASDAGCKTLIIPEANLHGEEGIERLPEALKDELQILSYEEWKTEGHAPFDPERHVLQVIAVEHVIQAADIAFVDQAEVDALPPLFRPMAISLADKLREPVKTQRACCCLFYPKEAGELDLRECDDSFRDRCRCLFMAPAEVKRKLRARHPDMGDEGTFFDPPSSETSFPSLVREIRQIVSRDAGMPVRLSLVAPYYFLLASGLARREHPGPTSGEDLRLFANNYTVQGFKIKACKPLLNRVLCQLALVPTADLEACPFLTCVNGIYTMDLSFIPEKYRLDKKRARSILTACLEQWLLAVKGRTLSKQCA